MEAGIHIQRPTPQRPYSIFNILGLKPFLQFSDDLLHHVLQGNQPGYTAVFIEDDGNLEMPLLEITQQADRPFGFGNEKWIAHIFPQVEGGITGSGVIDALAQLFQVGLVDQRGKFRDEVMDHPRVRKNDDGELEYVVAYEEEAALAEDIVLTQNDIRSIQMAKAAIQAGTRVLMSELDIDNPDRVLMAGAFGNYIDKESAMTIGMYPDIDPDDVVSLGNAAGVGAKLALLDSDRRAEAERIVDEVEYFEIAGTDVFQENFMESMYLPHQDFDLYPHVKERVQKRRELQAAQLDAE